MYTKYKILMKTLKRKIKNFPYYHVDFGGP